LKHLAQYTTHRWQQLVALNLSFVNFTALNFYLVGDLMETCTRFDLMMICNS